VAKLFNTTRPDVAVFGKKDYQQLLIIKRLTEELYLDIDISAGETVREADGLAMSSRNNRLSDEQRAIAPSLYTALLHVAQEYDFHRIGQIEEQAKNTIEKQGLKVEYLNIRDADSLQAVSQKTSNYVVLAAAWLGATRLIDNIVFQ
jgi:pantoate--beta-alanine ligase